MKRYRYGYPHCYDDYCHELDAEAEKRAHQAGECQGIPTCDYCIKEIMEENENED